MAAKPWLGTCTIDGLKIQCISITVILATGKDQNGMPQMGDLQTYIQCVIDFYDQENISYNTLNRLFGLANGVTRDKIKTVKLEFWTDDSRQDVLCSYNFRGWISGFRTYIPGEKESAGIYPAGNNLLVLTLVPIVNQKNVREISLSN